MAARIIRSLEDFIRHRKGIELVCRCGHRAVLEAHWVLDRFHDKHWSTSLEGAAWLTSAHARFFCSKCYAGGRGVVRPKRIGPGQR